MESRRSHWYDVRISAVCHYGNVYALTVLLIAQVIFLNLHYIIGASLSCIALLALVAQIVLSCMEQSSLTGREYARLESILFAHFVVNHLIMVSFIPFLIWTIVIMIQRTV
jgi:hypothetical protein